VTDRADLDVELVEQYLAGDVSAFDELMRAHQDRVFGICLRMLRDRDAALDASQETFVTVFRKAGQFAGRSAFSTWLYRVAVNTCHEPLSETNDPPDAHAEDQLGAVELRPDIERALESLPSEFRPAIILSDLEGLALQTVSEILGVPVGTVKSRVFRGRRLLADQLGNLRAPPNPPTEEHHA
jgi:RNA polymerase sigma-70 factor (ECF subfamily)